MLWDGGRGRSQAQRLGILLHRPAAETQLLPSALTALLSVVLAGPSGTAVWGTSFKFSPPPMRAIQLVRGGARGKRGRAARKLRRGDTGAPCLFCLVAFLFVCLFVFLLSAFSLPHTHTASPLPGVGHPHALSRLVGWAFQWSSSPARLACVTSWSFTS